jgi:Glycosyl hydrolase family 59
MHIGKPLTVCACLVPALASVLSARAGLAEQASIVIDGKSAGKTFDGLGAVSAGGSTRLLIDYPEPQRSRILDYLFKPGYGAALQHLKVEIGADAQSTDGSEPSHMRTPKDHDSSRGYEWWLMAEARKRNPRIVLEVLPWAAPRWVGEITAGKETLYSPRMAAYVVDFIRTAKHVYALDIAYAGIWNERDSNIPYIKRLHELLKTRQLSTRIVCCDGDWSIADAMLTDRGLAADIDVIGAHYPRDEQGKVSTTAAARGTGKPLWSSEDQPNSGGGPIVSRDWPIGGRILAQVYNQNYLQGSMTSTEIWSPVTSYYDNLPAADSGLMKANTPWSGHYEVKSTIWVTAHTTQFAQPGWRYLDSASGNLPEKGSYVSLRSEDGRNWSVILETVGAERPQTAAFRVTGGLADARVHVWETNNSRSFDHVASLTPVQGTFEYTFDPDSLYSLTTTSGQGKGLAQPPSGTPFPLPYADDFEHTPVGRAPQFLSDQDGAFEVRPCVGRPGRCLEQVILEKPVAWAAMPDPYTLAGDADWKDYGVAADVRFLSSAPARLMGRIDSANDWEDDGQSPLPSGYLLSMKPGGEWELSSVSFHKPVALLASGSAAIDRAQWHRLQLEFRGSGIAASLDGQQIAKVEDSAHARGMIALGTQWDRVQFDDLQVSGQ